MILYHGSNMEIETIDLDKCKPFKDFGKGFYTTPLREQAWTMAKRTARVYKAGRPCVTAFSVDDALFKDMALTIKMFDKPDSGWAHFIIHNRDRTFQDTQSPDCNVDGKYDIVAGPVANDDIAALIDVYLSGIISDEVLLKELTFRELSSQVSFHTQKSLTRLQKTEAYYE